MMNIQKFLKFHYPRVQHICTPFLVFPSFPTFINASSFSPGMEMVGEFVFLFLH